MTRKRPVFQRLRPHFRGLAVVALVLLAGCASVPPPVNRLSQAHNALQSALDAKAKVYAPLEIGFAQTKLAMADSAMQAKDYALAAQRAEESQADSELARVKAQLGRLHQQIKQAQADNQRLRARLLDTGSKNKANTGGTP